MNKKYTRNPFLLFLPFLGYALFSIHKHRPAKLFGDEIRYVDFAHRLMHGYYSPNPPHINLWNGPGYPLLITPFIAAHVPIMYIAMLNGVFLYLSAVLLYKAMLMITNHGTALMFGLLLALYPGTYPMLPTLYTETFTLVLVSAFVYSVVLLYYRRDTKNLWLCGIILGFLTLTKIIFGYVLLLGLVVSGAMLLFKQIKFYSRKSVYVLLIAFGMTVPYLVYTWHLTGKVMYWGNSGGLSLYWMSTPFNHEYGDWKHPDLENTQYPYIFKSVETKALLRTNHSAEVKAILKHNEVEQDALFKQAALRNIIHHPIKFASNYSFNVSRMLFNFPYSYSYQDAAIVPNILSGSLILWATLIGGVITWLNRRRMIYPVKLLLMLTGIYLLLSGALSAYPRQLDVVIPVFLFWIGFLKANMQTISLRFTGREDADHVSLTDLNTIPGIKTSEDRII